MLVGRQTNTQTNRHVITILRSPMEGGVVKYNRILTNFNIVQSGPKK